MIKTIRSGDQILLTRYVSKIFSKRRLIYDFGLYNLRAQYAQTTLGLLWVFIQPLVNLLIYSIFFGLLLNIKTGSLSFPVYNFSGLIIWALFINFFNNSYRLVHTQRDLIRKISFPAVILILSRLVPTAIEMMVFLIFFAAAVLIFGAPIASTIVIAPFFILLGILFSLALSMFFSVVSVRFRDALQLAPFIGGLGIWLTPVFYPLSILPGEIGQWLFFNPLTGLVEGFRWACFGWEVRPEFVIATVLFILLFFLFSLYLMKRAEKHFADKL